MPSDPEALREQLMQQGVNEGSEPTAEDRLAYRAIVWAHTCPFCEGVCPYGLPGCPQADWLLRFDELGWIDIAEGLE